MFPKKNQLRERVEGGSLWFPLLALWLPIVLAAVIVFIASSIPHMEDKVGAALRESGITPWFYMFPYSDHRQMKEPAMQEKFKCGTVGTVLILPGGAINLAEIGSN